MTDRDLVRVLVARRVALGWTQNRLALAMGVSRPTVARFETARRRSPTLFVIQRYAEAVGMKLHLETA